MSKGMNIPDGTTVYVPVVRENGNDDDHESTKFVIG